MAEEPIKLYRPAPGGTVEIYEIGGDTLAQCSATRAAQPDEIRLLIEELLARLPAEQLRVFKEQLMTEGMI